MGHTPGPWETSGVHVYAYHDETDEVVARLDGAAVNPAFLPADDATIEANAALIAAALMLAVPAPCADCGLKPLKPLPPLGCRDLVAQCICDAAGKNCRWQWFCVKS